MSNFNLQVAVNSTSIGQTTTNFLYNVFLKKLEPNIFPIGGIDISAFEEILEKRLSGMTFSEISLEMNEKFSGEWIRQKYKRILDRYKKILDDE